MKKLLLGLALVLGGFATAYAAGQFSTYPGVGVTANSVCIQYTNNNRCVTYQPAGPSTVTGNETVPADTNTGSTPFTVTIPSSYLLSGGTMQVVTSGTSGTIANGTNAYVLNGVGASYAVTLPANPWNGQSVEIDNTTAVAITTFSVAANTGQSLVGVAPTQIGAQTNNSAAAPSPRVVYRYNAPNATWYRAL